MATFEVTAPDGKTLEVNAPDGASQDDVMNYVKQNYTPSTQPANDATQRQPLQPPSDGLFNRIGQDWNKRMDSINQDQSAVNSGQQSALQNVLPMAGQAAGMGLDAIGEGLKSGYSTLYGRNLGQDVAPAANAATSALGSLPAIGGSTLGQTVPQETSALAQAHPIVAKNLAGAMNVAGLVNPVTDMLGGAAADGAQLALGGASKAGEAISDSGDAAAAAKKASFVQDLVTPKETPTVKADMFSRSTENGILRSRTVTPTPQEQAVQDTVSQLPVSPNKSLLANYNVISDANSKEAQSLISQLQKNDVAIPDDTIINGLSDIRNNLAKNPFVTGDGAKAAESVVNGALDHIANNPQTASGLLQARKDFDSWIKSQKDAKVFDPALESPVSAAVQQVRQGINNIVDQAVPDVGVKASLQKQSNLYRAMDNIETKGGAEGKNIISRAVQKAANVIPVKSGIAKGAVLAAGTAGAAAAPAVTGALGGLYLGGKMITSPLFRQGVGSALQAIGDAGNSALDYLRK